MKKLMFALALASLSSAAFAQGNSNANGIVEESTEVMTVPVNPYKVETNSFWSNWFFNFGGGVQTLFGDDADAGKFGKRISPAFNVGIGKWFTPGLGLRIQFNGLHLRSFTYGESAYTYGDLQPGGYYKQKFNYMNLHGDVLFNLNAMFGGYNPYRVYEVIPYVGLGWAHSFDWAEKQYFAANFGIINKFRLSNAWDFNIELSAMVTQDQFDTKVRGKGADAVVGAQVGFTYKFKPRGFRSSPDVNAIMAMTSAQMDAVNAALAEQIAQNNKLKQQLANQPTEIVNEKVVVKEIAPAPQSVFFEIGSAVIPARDEVNLKSIAELMQNNPNMTLSLTGYADSDTGSATWNKQLSENRANAVADALVKLGVSRDRLQVSGKGGVNTLVPPSFNRRVIIEAQ